MNKMDLGDKIMDIEQDRLRVIKLTNDDFSLMKNG